MADVPLFLIAGLFMIGGLVIVHEAGHYVVARLFKIGTPVFSIGMGPRVFGFHFWETDFRISILPIGGYVRMAGADAFGEENADETWMKPEEDFMQRPVWQRLLVMLAGPAANLILPFILFTGVYMMGQPIEDGVVGRVIPGSVAEQLGFSEQDQVVGVNEREIGNWREFERALLRVADGPVEVSVQRAGQARDFIIPAERVPGSRGAIVTGLGLDHAPLSSRVGVTDPTSPAFRAGFRTGDLVEFVDDQEVSSFRELQEALARGASHTVKLRRLAPVEGDEDKRETVDRTFTITADPAWSPAADEALPDPWGFIPIEVFVSGVVSDPPSAALAAGVEPGDRMVSIDGTPVRSWEDVVTLVMASADDLVLDQAASQSGGCSIEEAPQLYGRTLRLEISREGERQVMAFRPQVQRMVRGTEVTYRPIMGVRPYPGMAVRGHREPTYYGIGRAFPLAVEDGTSAVRQTLAALSGLLQGRLKPKETLGGPVEIFRTAGMAAQQGVHHYLMWMGVISFSLGILNLLPVPVLDGGQILFYTIEGIRGRPLPLALRERVQMVGVLFLAALMVVVFVNDIGRLFAG